ncbi:cyclophilin-like fold protein [Pseudactinotalea suaedae]|uniref:cyclophilin-like fold protein n=1 Tax=Pseudactinotalea suaedae TaxID=1524924 RepID=UPI0019D5C192|nr:cyclophilin-like fold protein [Pseudactinotalea suaedae]
MSTLHLSIDERVIVVELNDSSTAHDLASHLPLQLTFADFNGVEKIATLPAPLTMDGVPDGAAPEPNDLGYYAPSQSLVLYYGDVGYWNGIVRLGHLDEADMAFLQHQPDGFEATITAP